MTVVKILPRLCRRLSWDGRTELDVAVTWASHRDCVLTPGRDALSGLDTATAARAPATPRQTPRLTRSDPDPGRWGLLGGPLFLDRAACVVSEGVAGADFDSVTNAGCGVRRRPDRVPLSLFG